MAKVYIQGEKDPQFVTDAVARSLLADKQAAQNDAKVRSKLVDVNGRHVPVAKIKFIDLSSEKQQTAKAYDLDDPMQRAIITQFEKQLEQQANRKRVESLDYYGTPAQKKDWVMNGIFGPCHWSLVNWALELGVISRRLMNGKAYWSIVAHQGSDDSLSAAAYEEFRKKLDGLDELKGRRYKAAEKEKEALTAMLV